MQGFNFKMLSGGAIALRTALSEVPNAVVMEIYPFSEAAMCTELEQRRDH